MTFLSRAFLTLGSVLLIHACYSAREHSALLSLRKPSPSEPLSETIALPAVASTSLSNLTSLPLDITIETLISVALLCVAIVMGAEQLKPISWRVWAGDIEREKGLGGKEKSDKEILGEMGKGRSEGFEWLGEGGRRGFVDIRKQRKEFAVWAKGNGSDRKD